MLEWSLENLIKTCYYLAWFFTVVWVAKFVFFAAKMLKLKLQNVQIEKSFLFDEIYTVQSVSAFFIGFGWLGYFLLTEDFDVSVTYCMVSAVMAGFICLQISAKIMFEIKKSLFISKNSPEVTEVPEPPEVTKEHELSEAPDTQEVTEAPATPEETEKQETQEQSPEGQEENTMPSEN